MSESKAKEWAQEMKKLDDLMDEEKYVLANGKVFKLERIFQCKPDGSFPGSTAEKFFLMLRDNGIIDKAYTVARSKIHFEFVKIYRIKPSFAEYEREKENEKVPYVELEHVTEGSKV